jgi:hypothetical protein
MITNFKIYEHQQRKKEPTSKINSLIDDFLWEIIKDDEKYYLDTNSREVSLWRYRDNLKIFVLYSHESRDRIRIDFNYRNSSITSNFEGKLIDFILKIFRENSTSSTFNRKVYGEDYIETIHYFKKENILDLFKKLNDDWKIYIDSNKFGL